MSELVSLREWSVCRLLTGGGNRHHSIRIIRKPPHIDVHLISIPRRGISYLLVSCNPFLKLGPK